MNRKYRKTIIAGNWKMNMTPAAVKPFTAELAALVPGKRPCDVVLCVPFPLIPALSKAKFPGVSVGAQNVSQFEKGAYTGEVSCAMLTELGVKYCIVGHSERRAYFGETDETVNAKAGALLAAGVTPVICVGETLEQRERGLTMELISLQVKAALSGFEAAEARKCVIAYEPIWAIGTGRTATAEQAEEVCAHIRAGLRARYGARVARGISILYGGSMNAGNAKELLRMEDIDGGLIGGASLKPAELAKIIGAAE